MRSLLCGLLLLASACGLDRNIDRKVTIHQGVYGLLVDAQDQPALNVAVFVYAAGHVGAPAMTTSDRDGVYQIALPPGDYTLCTMGCTVIAVPASGKVRYDWTGGPAGGHWDKL
jgi:hypothetical protein